MRRVDLECHRNLVVIGTSMGGLAALSELFRHIPSTIQASFFVVQHIGARVSRLPEILATKTALKVTHAIDQEKPALGSVYIAPPDVHMLLQDDHIRLVHGPKENHTRPAIDPLFRSAALAHGNRVIGIVLTGYLDDGTAGLDIIKRCGGMAMVQDPEEAYASEMPASALANVAIDFSGPVEQLAAKIIEVTQQHLPAHTNERPVELMTEHLASIGEGNMMEHLEKIATPSVFVCPECGGTLWGLKDSRPPRYRCHTGHAYTLANLSESYAETVEAKLWSAVRALQDQQMLMLQVARTSRQQAEHEKATDSEKAAAEFGHRALTIERMIEGQKISSADDLPGV